jgi:tripeptide aminopeptidase
VFDVEALQTFTAIAAPTGAEDERLAWLERRLERAAGVRERDGVGNLIWRGAASGDPPAALVMAHVDTVFAADTPLEVRRDGGDLVGPGIGDNAAAVIALVSVLEAMGEPPADVAIAFTVGEEGLGNLRGAIHACTELRPHLALAVEGHGLDHVVNEHVGSLRARIEVTGPGGHSWWDRGTPSAVHGLVEIAGELVRSGANVGRIDGGGAVNAIASKAEMLVERRSLIERELSEFGQCLDKLSVAQPLALRCEVVGRRGAGRLPGDHPLVRAVMAARRRVGLPEAFGSGSTDANAAIAQGIPAVAIGCGRGSGMHTVCERIALDSLKLGCLQLEAVLRSLAALSR